MKGETGQPGVQNQRKGKSPPSGPRGLMELGGQLEGPPPHSGHPSQSPRAISQQGCGETQRAGGRLQGPGRAETEPGGEQMGSSGRRWSNLGGMVLTEPCPGEKLRKL